MKKSIAVITSCIIFILLLSGCGSPIKVNERLAGEGEYWSVTLNVKGRADAKKNDSDVYEYTSYGSYDLLIKYIGDTDDLQDIRRFVVDGPGDIGSTMESDDPSFLETVLHKKGSPSAQTLVYFYYNNEYFITIEWDGEISGEETIKLN